MKESLIGKKFGKLTVLKTDKPVFVNNRYRAAYFCLCDCGKSLSVLRKRLLDKTRSFNRKFQKSYKSNN